VKAVHERGQGLVILWEHRLHHNWAMSGGLWDLIASQITPTGVDTEKDTQVESHRQPTVLPPLEGEANPDDPAFLLTPLASKRFEYVRRIGAGGMGSVYCVRDRHLLREVAIKLLSPALAAEPKYVRRFMAEAQIQAQLDHPNIVPVHEMNVDVDGTSYFTMRMVHGRSLADRISATHLGPRPAESMHDMLVAFLKVCDAVAFAHNRGVLHLDIKPENIFMEDFGAVYLMDWGLARLTEKEPVNDGAVSISLTAADAWVSGVAGSPSYMSPEQAEGSSGRVSERTDVFGLGAVLYAMLAGRAPYLADTIEEVVQQARVGQMPPLPELPFGATWLGRVVGSARKAMAMNPADRHPGALALKNEVEELAAGGVGLAALDSVGEQP
jgi:eukaryotic-like serine/threonine-protein kinase